MKTVFLGVALAIAAMSITASAAPAKSPQLLSVQYFETGGATVALPTVKTADGTVCVSYVADAIRQDDGSVDTTVKQVCGKPVANSASPETLHAMLISDKAGLIVETPVVGK